MPTSTSNRVRELRELRGFTQHALAQAAGLSRQSVNAIEAGRAMPAVDVALRIARALECSIEELFDQAGAPAALSAIAAAGTSGAGRVVLAQIGGRWVSHRLESAATFRACADGLATRARGNQVEVEPLRSPERARDNLLISGCAAGLGLLADRLNTRRGPGRFVWLPRSSTVALEELARGLTHVAGVHLTDPRTGEANIADVRRIGCERARVVIAFARWEVGLVAARRNPKSIRGIADLGRRGVQLVVREPGSGARRLLEQQIRAAELSLDLVRNARACAYGHLEVAHAVSLGAADTGVATRDAAIAYDLDFVPLVQERFDLAVRADELADPRLQRLFDLLTSRSFRRELASVGYDVEPSGDRVAQIDAA
ncbi:MAG TPA: substrate-binding domain-containing protein [Polyangiales bacterium]|nr:substrate-binding domain-containing protein [Polyangiales bacterium]